MQTVQKSTRKRQFSRILLWAAAGVLVIGAAYASWYFLLRKPSGSELYRDALGKSLVVKSEDGVSKQAYMSAEIKSDDIKVDLQARGDLNGDDDSNMRGRATLQVDFTIQGVPLSTNVDLLFVPNAKEAVTYRRVNSFTSSDPDYKGAVDEYYSPIINKWAKLDASDDKDDDTPTTFEDDGPIATLSILGAYMPMSELSHEDRAAYLRILDEYHLFQVADKYEKTQIRGLDAFMVRVTINKHALQEVDSELNATLSKDAKYKTFSNKFIDEWFGQSDTHTANIYIDTKNHSFIGYDLKVQPKEPIEEKSFDTKMSTISITGIVKYDGKLDVKVPDGAMSESEYNDLLSVQ